MIEAALRPFELKSLKLSNRFVMAPMTRNHSPNGVPGQNVADYYTRRAEGGVGLIISEGAIVNRPSACNHFTQPHIYGEAALKGWKTTIDQVHARNGKMGVQLFHVGAMPDPRFDWAPPVPPESPSNLYLPGEPERGVSMSEEDIADVITAFADAARDAKQLGFDTLEIHGAHGYLIDEFFWSETNKRTGKYGGKSLAERSRFAVELVRTMRDAVGPHFPIIMRVSQWKQTAYDVRMALSPDELESWLGPIKEAGVDMFHGSQRNIATAEFPEIDGEHGLNLAGWIKKLIGTPTISVGSVGLAKGTVSRKSMASDPAPIDKALERLARGEFDLIAVGRAILTDPQWVNKVLRNDFDQMLGVEERAFFELT